MRFKHSLITGSLFPAILLCFNPALLAEGGADGIRWMNRWDASCYTGSSSGANQCRQDWYETTQGSHLVLWEVIKMIEAADSEELFSERESLSRYGFLYPEAAAYDPATENYNGYCAERVERGLSVDGLPLGFLEDKSRLDNRNYLGLSCAACHTGRLITAIDATTSKAALKIDYLGGQVDRNTLTPTAYRAKPLDGIAFTGPYLHNGSVRTLSDLLKRPADRPASFRVGSTQYDVQNAAHADAGDFVLDTTLRGNRNGGHDYGTALPSADKAALLEFLKSL